MNTTRREFLERAAIQASAALALGACGVRQSRSAETAQASERKRILILGGTGFLGPKTVEAALARGHQVSVFNRGRTEKRIPFEFKDVEHLYGNRDPLLPADDAKGPDGKLLNPDGRPRGLEQLEGKRWDAIIDNSGYYPRHVKASADLLAKAAKQYIYISSISAYAGNKDVGADESAPLAKLTDPTVETMGANFENYGGLKVLCEQAAEAAFPGRTAVVRPGYIVGPGDPTDRFTYWPARAARGGEMLAPGSPSDPLQWIDVRDLAEWLVLLVERGTAGVFNAIGPNGRGHWGEVLGACVNAAPTRPTLVWVPTEWLSANGMGGEDSFPIWAPPMGEMAGFHTWSNARAVAAGLRFRTMEDTVGAIHTWLPGDLERRARVTQQMIADAKAKGQPPPKMADPKVLRAGPTAERERELLEKWKRDSKK